jgi:pSer/pThr/pTyr-binding forkhead associated (FHA) protein
MTDKLPEIDILVKTHKGQKNYHYSSNEVIIGRSKKTDLHIPVEGMSRKHFKIIFIGQALAIVDLGSANGTLLNNKPLTKDEPVPFLKGDIIEIPGVHISFLINYVFEEESEVLITEEMLTEDGEDEENYTTDTTDFDSLEVMPKEKLNKTLVRGLNNDHINTSSEIDESQSEHLDPSMEHHSGGDSKAMLLDVIDSLPDKEMAAQTEERIGFEIESKKENSNISLSFDELDNDSDIDINVEDVELTDDIEVSESNICFKQSVEMLSSIEAPNDSSIEAIEQIKIDLENIKEIELSKIREDLDILKNQELEKMNKITKDRELELKILSEEFDQSKKIELEKIKLIEGLKSNELVELQKEKEGLERLIEKEQVHFERLEKEKQDEIKKEKKNALLLIEEECLEYKYKLIDKSRFEAEREKRNILDQVENEEDKLLKKAKKVLNEAREEAEIIVLHAEKESRKNKDDSYEEILESQRHNHIELQNLRRDAEEDAKSYYSNLKDQAVDILKNAKAEAANIKDTAIVEIEYIKESAESVAEIAHTEADRIRKESNEQSRMAKVQSDKILKNAYATAMLIKNTSQESYDLAIDEDKSFFDELEDGYPRFEADHQNKVQNIFSLINKTSEEMDEVLKEKQQIYEEENRHLRESELKRIQIEAREGAIKIKAQAESEAEEIIRNAYLHSKKIEIEATTRIKEKELELKELSSLSSVEISEKSTELTEIILKEKELAKMIIELEESREMLQAQNAEEKKRFESFFNESIEKEKYLVQQSNELELEYTNWCNRLSKARTNFGIFETESHEIKDDLASQLRTLDTDKEKLLVVINPLRDEVIHLRKEKEDLYQENSHFFDNLKTRKFEYEKLKELNERLEQNIQENKITIDESKQVLVSQNENLADLDFQLKNISLELKSKRDENEREIEIILNDAKVEERNLRDELEVIKANKQAYAEAEIAQIKINALDECRTIVANGEDKKKNLIEEGHVETKRLKDETNLWIKEVQERIEIKNSEIEKIEEEGRLFLIERNKEAEEQFSEKMLLANNQISQQQIDSKSLIKKNEDDSNKKILIIGEKFQHKMKKREQLFKEEKSGFLAAIEKTKVEIIALANSNASLIITKSESKAQSILAEANARKEEIEKKKESVLSTIENESSLLRAKLNDQLSEHKEMAEREICQMKIKEFETIKHKRIEVEEQIESRKNKYVFDITENVGLQLQLKMGKIFGKKMTETDFLKLKDEVKGIVEASVFPNKDDSSKPKKILIGAGQLTDRVKKFYIRVSIGVLTPIVLLIINALFPQFFPSIKGLFISSITTDESASDIFLKKEINKKRNRPMYQPKYIEGFKANYTDNMIYTKSYAELVTSSAYIDKWTISLNTYLVDELGLNDNLIVNLISYENNLHRQLLEIKTKINPDFVDQGISRMREKENEYAPKIRSLFKTDESFMFFNNYKRTFFSNNIKKNK